MMTFALGKRRIMNNLNRYMDQTIAWSREPFPKHRGDPSVPNDVFSALLAPVTLGARLKVAVNEADNHLLLTTLALRAYRVERGSYPQTLEELREQGYLKTLPADPFSAPGRELLCYRRDGTRYVLYSVGPDGKDDKGRAIEQKGEDGRVSYAVRPESTGDIVAGVSQ